MGAAVPTGCLDEKKQLSVAAEVTRLGCGVAAEGTRLGARVAAEVTRQTCIAMASLVTSAATGALPRAVPAALRSNLCCWSPIPRLSSLRGRQLQSRGEM